MWRTDSLWFETAIVLAVFAVGNLFFGHFEQHNRPVRRLAKMAIFLGITLPSRAPSGAGGGSGGCCFRSAWRSTSISAGCLGTA